MDGFIAFFEKVIPEAGISKRYIFPKSSLELPGFSRPTKEWDLLVVKDNKLAVAIEAKSQVGPSFGGKASTDRTEQTYEEVLASSFATPNS